MSIQGSINSMLGVAAAGKKLKDLSGAKPQSAAASQAYNESPETAQPSAKPATPQPIPTYDDKKAKASTDFLKVNRKGKKSQKQKFKARKEKITGGRKNGSKTTRH